MKRELTHDGGVGAFDSVDAATGDGINFDDVPVVTVEAPADFEQAFETDRFYKVEGATVARPIKQPYIKNDEVVWYKKPAEELKKAAWSFDNAPFTLGHPDTGMVKSVDDVHGFWRSPRYDGDEDRLKEDLFVPVTDDEARAWVESHQDVSIGYYDRVHSDYDGNTGDISDDDVDGFQVDLFGNHIAGVEHGRCSSGSGCGLGLDSSHESHGKVVMTVESDQTTSFELASDQESYSEGTMVSWSGGNARGEIVDVKESGCFNDRIDGDVEVCANGEPAYLIEEDDGKTVAHKHNTLSTVSTDSTHGDAPSGIYVAEDGTWLAVGPNEHPDDNTEHPDDGKFPVDNCSDVDDAWGLRGHTGSINIDKSTLGNRIQRAAEAMGCDVPGEGGDMESDSTDSNTDTNMSDTNGDGGGDFDVPDLSIDALADKNDAVSELKEKRDSLKTDVAELEADIEETRKEIEAAFDEAEHFSVHLEEDDCVCDAVEQLVEDLDEKAEEVSALKDDLSEYREDEREERLDDLSEYGAVREEWEDASLDEIEEEIDRRKEVAEDLGVSVKEAETETTPETDSGSDTDVHGRRSLPRGYGA
jgi:outer membrane murein-binding lipoprotein Lpp